MWIRFSALVLAFGFSAIASRGTVKQEQDLPTGSNRPFMQIKMDHAKSILEGIALEGARRRPRWKPPSNKPID